MQSARPSRWRPSPEGFLKIYSYRNGWMGRRLFGLLHEAGLMDIAVETFVRVVTDHTTLAAPALVLEAFRSAARRAQETGAVSEAEAARWVASLEEAARAGRYFAAATEFVVGGRKP